ncbi:MAG: universal stress protein [Candidatus Cloacimonetes bacterium]|nr:universal stress protein [Candidatus Cloacimonadota bacterium]
MERVLVAIDLSDESEIVLKYASRFASQFKAQLCVVHCESIEQYMAVAEDDTMGEFNGVMLPEVIRNRKKALKNRLNQIKLNLQKKNLKVKSVLLEGPTVDNILEEAKAFKADLIIVGSHKHGKFYHLLFGSTHDAIIKHSNFPVLVVPPDLNVN